MVTPERAGLYEEVVGNSVLRLRVHHSVGEAVRSCVSDPGRAVLMDMATTLHAGVSETAPLYELGIDLPILRCTQSESGVWTAMCQAPFKRLPLQNALDEIAGRDPSWRHPKYIRRFVRVPLTSRVRYRILGQKTWLKGNCSNASISGLFLLAMDIVPIASELEVEIIDLAEPTQGLRAMVTWSHSWDQGPHLPGMGLDFDRKTVPTSFREALAELYVRRKS